MSVPWVPLVNASPKPVTTDAVGMRRTTALASGLSWVMLEALSSEIQKKGEAKKIRSGFWPTPVRVRVTLPVETLIVDRLPSPLFTTNTYDPPSASTPSGWDPTETVLTTRWVFALISVTVLSP